jgi:hypothetical protein
VRDFDSHLRRDLYTGADRRPMLENVRKTRVREPGIRIWLGVTGGGHNAFRSSDQPGAHHAPPEFAGFDGAAAAALVELCVLRSMN